MDDSRLVQLARRGDKAAFAALLARHRPLLDALCRRALGDPELAEDAAQEAVLEALLSLDRLERAERFGAWLGGIGLNVCRRWLRERGRARAPWPLEAVLGGRAAPGWRDWADADAGPEELAETAEMAERVRRAIEGLPPGQRAAVRLFYLGGLPHREVAAALGIGVGAVKTRLHKGRVALREELRLWKEETMSAEQRERWVPMRVAEVRRRPAVGDQAPRWVVLLDEVDGTRRLAIWIGEIEAASMALTLEGVTFPRPMTFQFAASLLDAAGGRLEEGRITRLADETFYAVAVVGGPGGAREIDARPSDVLNLALLAGAPIRVDPDVLETASALETAAASNLTAEAATYPDTSATIVEEALAAREAHSAWIRGCDPP